MAATSQPATRALVICGLILMEAQMADFEERVALLQKHHLDGLYEMANKFTT
jgi:hypothetical protein